jgi:hypothetical protein
MLEVLRLLLTTRFEAPRIPWSVPLTAPELLTMSLFRILNPFPPAPVPETVAAVWTLIVRLSSVPVPKAVPTAVVVPLHVTTAPLVVHTAHASEPANNAAAKTAATAPVLGAAFRAPIHGSERAFWTKSRRLRLTSLTHLN